MVHAKNISVVQKDKGYEVRFLIGFDKSASKKDLGKAFPERMCLAFNGAADQTEIENRIKIEMGRLRLTYEGKKQSIKPTDDAKLDQMNRYFEGKLVK